MTVEEAVAAVRAARKRLALAQERHSESEKQMRATGIELRKASDEYNSALSKVERALDDEEP